MSTVHTLSSLSRPLTPDHQQHLSPTPSRLQLLPTTTDHASSPFQHIQSGPTRTIMPTFTSPLGEQRYRKEHLVLIFRALHRAGLAEGVAGMSRPSFTVYTSVILTFGFPFHLYSFFFPFHVWTGHCSTRDPVEPNTFWVNPQGRSFARMRISDLVRVDEDGKVVEGDRPVDASATWVFFLYIVQ